MNHDRTPLIYSILNTRATNLISLTNRLSERKSDNKELLFNPTPIRNDNIKVRIELTLFFFFVFDFTLHEHKQSTECRQICTGDIILFISKAYQDTLREVDLNCLFNKRMAEYGECSQHNEFLKPPAVIFNFLSYNIKYANDYNDFYMFEGQVRPLNISGISKMFIAEIVFLNEFAAFSVFVHTIIKDTASFLSLNDEEFNGRLQNAAEIEKKFWDSLHKRGITC